MSNVITLKHPLRRLPMAQRWRALPRLFAEQRRRRENVFWLKENAELLGILASTGAGVNEAVCEVYAPIYEDLPDTLTFFPQYYRFHLSICLDLEDLGMPGRHGSRLSAWVAQQGLPEAEMSDLQRAEARRLLARRGVAAPADATLTDRLHAFMARSETFAVPNKKAAYELTHIVFYLSEYGARDPHLSAAALRSLNFAGTLAWLDQNTDLLAEICVALRYAGAEPPAAWEAMVIADLEAAQVRSVDNDFAQDDYHIFLMAAWLSALNGAKATGTVLPHDGCTFHMRQPDFTPMRQLSAYLLAQGAARDGDWDRMGTRLAQRFDRLTLQIIAAAEQDCDDFGRFFSDFARAELVVSA
ncbi:MAG: hypothetical protein AAF965_00455 [Pseudomonadota bacterium]